MTPANPCIAVEDCRQGLLVSVRDAGEAAVAECAGASIIDVKEPLHGPLGRAAAGIAAEIITAVGARAAVTLACGELVEGPVVASHIVDVMARRAVATDRPVAVKVGPAGLDAAEWVAAFGRVAAAVPAGVDVVAVAYADWQKSRAPTPEAILLAAAGAGARTVLIDTFDKAGEGLFGLVSHQRVAEWAALARDKRLVLAVAGKLSAADVTKAFALGADVVGVRSAACEGGRHGQINPTRVRELVRLVPRRLRALAPIPKGDVNS